MLWKYGGQLLIVKDDCTTMVGRGVVWPDSHDIKFTIASHEGEAIRECVSDEATWLIMLYTWLTDGMFVRSSLIQ